MAVVAHSILRHGGHNPQGIRLWNESAKTGATCKSCIAAAADAPRARPRRYRRGRRIPRRASAAEVRQAAIACGLKDLGENRVQEAEAKIGALVPAGPGRHLAPDRPLCRPTRHGQGRRAFRRGPIARSACAWPKPSNRRAAAGRPHLWTVFVQVNTLLKGGATRAASPPKLWTR